MRRCRDNETRVRQRVIRLVSVLVVLALGALGLFAAERRAARASNTLRRELLDLGPVPSPRPPHTPDVTEGATAQRFVGLFDPAAPARIDALLEATHAQAGGLPPGLEVGTAGRDSWAAVPAVANALQRRVEEPSATETTCLDALAVGRDLARGGGTLGLSAGLVVTQAIFPRCGALLTSASPERQALALTALTQLLAGSPTLARAFREGDLDAQIHTFGRWMRPQDVEALSPAIQQAARTAQVLSTHFWKRQALLGVWVRASKTTHAAMNALVLPAAERDQVLERLEGLIDTPSVGLLTGWRTAIAQHERRLALLRLLHLATRFSFEEGSTRRWPALSAVESGDFTLVRTDDTATLTLRDTAFQLTLHARTPR